MLEKEREALGVYEQYDCLKQTELKGMEKVVLMLLYRDKKYHSI
jgi:hypothetical protein